MNNLLKKIKDVFGAEEEEGIEPIEEKSSPLPAPSLEEAYGPKIGREPALPVAPKETALPPLPPVVKEVIPPTVSRGNALPPASQKRDEVLRFIIHGLRPYINEKNTGIKGIRLFILCRSKDEENLVNIALYADRPGKFKQDVLERKFSDHYIHPERQWNFEFNIVRDQLPECKISEGRFGMDIITDLKVSGKYALAKITILSGQAEKGEYILDPSVKLKYKIGRGQNQALPSGMMHKNDIAFYSKEEAGFEEGMGTANLTVSRYHVMIVFDPLQKRYFIAADKGGTPDSGNKTKLFSEDGKMTRLDIPGALHVLEDGDQVEMGGSARFKFERVS